MQRLESEVRRKAEERARRLAQERARVTAETDVQRKAAAAAFARSFVASMRRGLVGFLGGAGYFYDPRRREVETAVLPDILAGELESRVQRFRGLIVMCGAQPAMSSLAACC